MSETTETPGGNNVNQQAFERGVQEILNGIELCRKNHLFMSGLILLYTGIDIMASLNRPQLQERVKPKDFEKWVKRYLLPGTNLRCSPSDLYAARCGLVHTYTAESTRSRKGGAKEIYYSWGTVSPEGLQQMIDLVKKPAVALNLDELCGAFSAAVERFKEILSKNPEKAKLVYERAYKFFRNVPQRVFEELSLPKDRKK